MSVKSIWFIISVSFTVSFLNLCFIDLSPDKSGMLKSPMISVCCSIYSLSFSRLSFMNVVGLAFGASCSGLRDYLDRFCS